MSSANASVRQDADSFVYFKEDTKIWIYNAECAIAAAELSALILVDETVEAPSDNSNDEVKQKYYKFYTDTHKAKRNLIRLLGHNQIHLIADSELSTNESWKILCSFKLPESVDTCNAYLKKLDIERPN